MDSWNTRYRRMLYENVLVSFEMSKAYTCSAQSRLVELTLEARYIGCFTWNVNAGDCIVQFVRTQISLTSSVRKVVDSCQMGDHMTRPLVPSPFHVSACVYGSSVDRGQPPSRITNRIHRTQSTTGLQQLSKRPYEALVDHRPLMIDSIRASLIRRRILNNTGPPKIVVETTQAACGIQVTLSHAT